MNDTMDCDAVCQCGRKSDVGEGLFCNICQTWYCNACICKGNTLYHCTSTNCKDCNVCKLCVVPQAGRDGPHCPDCDFPVQ
jgi:hypothetical protein